MSHTVFYLVYLKYFLKIGSTIKMIFTNQISFLIFLPTMIAITALSNIQKAIILLGIFFILDFITGIAASYMTKKKKEKNDSSIKDMPFLSSEKFKMSIVKAFVYCSSILSVYGVEKVFFIKEFHFNIVEQKMSVTLIAIAFCCFVEFYSIFFENFKDMGYDIVSKVKKINLKAKSLRNSVVNVWKD